MPYNIEELLECRLKDLGLIDYEDAYRIQKFFVEDILKGGKDILLLCEHPTIFTLGRLADEKNILISKEDIKEKKFEFKKVDRGGDITLHSPGQLVIYPIFNLKNKGRNLKSFLNKLEEVVIDLLKGFDIVATRLSGQTGVWVQDKKIASIGIGVRRWISYHGMAINVDIDLKLFEAIRPCGLDVEMTSISRIKESSVNITEVKERILDIFNNKFHLFIHEQ